MTSSDANRVIGDYRLKHLMLETPLTCQWQAEQISVGRKVLVDELKPEAVGQRAEFMADVRAKAAIEHPLIASVFEAVDGEEECYYAYEFLPGASLEARKDAGEPFKPLELAMLLRRIAEIHIMFERQKQPTSPMNLEHLHVDASGVLRVANLVVAGDRSERESARDMTYLGRALLPLVADGKEGTTRLLTLLAWMRGESDEGDTEVLSWKQVIELCERIERQLTGEPTIQMIESPVIETPTKSRPIGLLVMTGVLALAVVILLARNIADEKEAKGRVELPPPVSITSSGDASSVTPFRIMAYEVTIGEYLQFLSTLADLKEAGGDPTHYNHSEQPESKPGHEPDDWNALLAAAREGAEWKGQRVTLDTPVVGVDWWDAMAYSTWKRGRLPTEPEWRAALGMETDKVGNITAAGWGRVDLETKDRSAHGVLNMAGSVSEWTRLQTADPVNPLGARKWLILGGSYQQSQGHALSREWVDARDVRRSDLGFRLVFDTE